MKKKFVYTVLLIFPLFVWSQTSVNGTQSGIWTLAGSPYLVTGHTSVLTGSTLTIEPGVEVNFQGHYKLTVEGNIQAIGTEASPILFTTNNQATGWGGIRLESSVGISGFSYCRIEYGKTAGDYPDMHGGAVALVGSDAVFSFCIFADNEATADDNGMGGAVYGFNTGSMEGPLTRFLDCIFIRNHAYGEGGAIKFTGDMNTEIKRCTFIENDCRYGGGAISFYSVVDTKMDYCLFADNYTMFASGGAIHTLGIGNTLHITNCTFSGNNAIAGEGGAISLVSTSAILVNSIVYNNPGMYGPDLFLGFGGYAEVHYSNLPMPGSATGGSNIEADPQFVDANNQDYHLLETSPCIDAGTAYIMVGTDVLVDLTPDEYDGPAPDMGAFELEHVLTYSEMLPLWHIEIDVIDLIGMLPLVI